jgi:hypothetical protein
MALYLEFIPAEDEESKLKGAVGTHGDKDWVAISALVPGRTRKQFMGFKALRYH